jgi:hypothetical protein
MGWEREHPDELAIDRWVVRIAVLVISLFIVLVSAGIARILELV